jgi:hypothetical protein
MGGSSCRFCRVLETPQSKHLQLCSAIISVVDNNVQALRASTSEGSSEQPKTESAGAAVTPFLAAGAVAVVAVAAFAVHRARDRSNEEDTLVTPTHVLHRNEPLCTL